MLIFVITSKTQNHHTEQCQYTDRLTMFIKSDKSDLSELHCGHNRAKQLVTYGSVRSYSFPSVRQGENDFTCHENDSRYRCTLKKISKFDASAILLGQYCSTHTQLTNELKTKKKSFQLTTYI